MPYIARTAGKTWRATNLEYVPKREVATNGWIVNIALRRLKRIVEEERPW